MASKHFMIYYNNGTGTYFVTEPMPWAKENRAFFWAMILLIITLQQKW